MVERVYERARAASRVDRVLVATDDARIADVVRGGFEALTTPGQDHLKILVNPRR